MKKYDCIFSLGEACFISSALKNNNLRMFSGPFDWMYGASFKTRCDMLENKFKNYFNKDDFEFLYYRENNEMAAYRNKKSGMVYNHDFRSDLPFDYMFDSIKEKYKRRIDRLLSTLERSKSALIVYGDLSDTINGATDEEMRQCLDKINRVFAPTKIDLLYVRYNPRMKDGSVNWSYPAENIMIAECNSYNPANASPKDISMRAVLKNISKPSSIIKSSFFNKIKKKVFRLKKSARGIRFKIFGITVIRCKTQLLLEYINKKHVFDEKENLTNIILGSSHANRGLNSMFMSQPTVNLATTSQDLYESFHLCKFAVENKPSVKNVILFYAPFSCGYNISHSSEKYRAAYLDRIFKIKPFQEDKAIEPFYKKRHLKLFNDNSINADNNPLYDSPEIVEDDVKIRAEKHVELSQAKTMIPWLEKTANFLQEHHVNLYVIIPPYTEFYKKCLPSNIFDDLYDFCSRKNVSLTSFLDDESFTLDDFYDGDHLNFIGAIKLTNKISNLVEVGK